jgi:hypothetical protein
MVADPDTNDDAATPSAARHVRYNQSRLFYGQRLALLGQVTTALNAVISQEQCERRVLNSLFAESQQFVEASLPAAGGGTAVTPFDPLRVGLNRIEQDEHQVRWETVHAQSAIHKQMYAHHLNEVYRLSANARESQRRSRCAMEREALMRAAEIFAHWERQRATLEHIAAENRRFTFKLSTAREAVRSAEVESREIVETQEELQRRQLRRLEREFKREALR